ncbi:MAG TPA: type VI secretion system baseplate subunit TssE [Myxococcota bacterium]|nr:type VI secretion system baseplate subunit TssE [Myxococcota bacterium]
MAKPGRFQILRPSVLDRLLEGEAKGPGYPEMGLRELKAAVARDLEWLLNTKSVLSKDSGIEELPEARHSILTYGIPDFSTASWRSHNDAQRICAELGAAVRTFEPRLLPSTVRVTMLPTQSTDDFRMRFRIEATLHVEPISEPVYFDSSVEMDTGAIQVEGGL